jgi:hypothetical protein
MTQSDREDRKSGPVRNPYIQEASGRGGDALPFPAQRTLDRIADALGLATALLQQDASSERLQGPTATLMEASVLLQAFVQIECPGTRQRCLAFVRSVLAEADDV